MTQQTAPLPLVTRLEAARQALSDAVNRHFKGEHPFRICIPAQPDDTDVVIHAALCDAIAALAAPKLFPIMGKLTGTHLPSIPWAAIAPSELQARRNHDQTLDRLAERGGLSPSEAIAVLEGRHWHSMDWDESVRRLNEIVAERSAFTAPRQDGWQEMVRELEMAADTFRDFSNVLGVIGKDVMAAAASVAERSIRARLDTLPATPTPKESDR